MQTETRSLELNDLSRLALALRVAQQPEVIFREVYALACETLGCKLFTIMSFDAERYEVERLYTNMPTVYPPGGRKKKRGSAWAGHTLGNLQPFRATDPEGIRAAFDDHAVITGMGLGSILNIPVAYDGRCVGTMNLTHVEAWYTQAHEGAGLLLASFLAAPLALYQRQAKPQAAPPWRVAGCA
ncbi:GAF domain-containing protein [Paraburkholderia rhizosphaerae]|uniref:GAF domain-containing protein n=1 Tax=Paraburkholderia rhizosphaerae TaxID=480658 RepID=A0A4R8LWH3_9BURK|nr:GAF domain-containing protein [Paraburkholderia rhizosphaerae]TDY51968.1 GAF domain-containing protein [Paraburkholderia rhizosphaerae]